jgi:hypothetical protein
MAKSPALFWVPSLRETCLLLPRKGIGMGVDSTSLAIEKAKMQAAEALDFERAITLRERYESWKGGWKRREGENINIIN